MDINIDTKILEVLNYLIAFVRINPITIVGFLVILKGIAKITKNTKEEKRGKTECKLFAGNKKV